MNDLSHPQTNVDSVATTLRRMRSVLSNAELKVAAVLLSNYPVAGLQNISVLARKAGVSDPTVTRLVTKLGFDGFASFKASLQYELEERLMPPTQVEPRGSVPSIDSLATTASHFFQEISKSLTSISPEEIETAVAWLADQSRHVFVLGGRVSSAVARILAWELQVLRPNVIFVDESSGERTNRLLDVNSNSVVVAFDFRRYQIETYEFVEQAHRNGAKAILFTDPFLSPSASHCDVVFYASIEGLSPFNSLTPSLALVETLVSLVIPRLGEESRLRLKRYVEISERTRTLSQGSTGL